MKQILLLLFISLFFINDSHGQYISKENGFLAKKYVQEGVHLRTKKQFLSAVESNPQVQDVLRKSFNLANISTVISTLGGFGVGFGLASSDSNASAGTAVAAGFGLLAVAFPLSIISGKKIKKAINLYNEDFKPQDVGINSLPTFNLKTTSNGMGLVMTF